MGHSLERWAHCMMHCRWYGCLRGDAPILKANLSCTPLCGTATATAATHFTLLVLHRAAGRGRDTATAMGNRPQAASALPQAISCHQSEHPLFRGIWKGEAHGPMAQGRLTHNLSSAPGCPLRTRQGKWNTRRRTCQRLARPASTGLSATQLPPWWPRSQVMAGRGLRHPIPRPAAPLLLWLARQGKHSWSADHPTRTCLVGALPAP